MSLLILFDGGEPGTPINIIDIDVLSTRLVRIEFDDEVVVDDNYNNPNNYSISVVEGSGPVEIDRVLAVNTDTSLDIILVTQPMTHGTTYKVSATDLSTRTGDIFALEGDYESRDTKVDSSLRSIPKHFDKRPESLLTSVLIATGRSDDIIGGSRSDDFDYE